jgi:hypothetical protein
MDDKFLQLINIITEPEVEIPEDILFTGAETAFHKLVHQEARKKEAIKALGSLGDPRAIPFLEIIASDDNQPDLAKEAIWAIKKINMRNPATSKLHGDGNSQGFDITCPECYQLNNSDAKWCKRCKASLVTNPPVSTSNDKLETIPHIKELTQELLKIGQSRGYVLTDESDMAKEKPSRGVHGGLVRDPRTREIGERLHIIGGIEAMRTAHTVILNHLGSVRARELESAWHKIGSWIA